ncbi:MAG: DUF4352 domain-containing protein [Lachnospiraceae bacterium]|nr:DUF4352 domain-containing protein [Lachnospiraceae bacterium]
MFVKRFTKVILIGCSILIAGALVGCVNPQRRVQSQLEGLDNTSKSAILEWIEDVAQVDFEQFSIMKTSLDTNDDFISTSVLDSNERFVEWSFRLWEDGTIDLEFFYKPLVEFVTSQLEGFDSNSLGEILAWKSDALNDDELFITYRSLDRDGDWLDSDVIDNEEQFIEWTFDIDRFGSLSLEFVYDGLKTFVLGDTFQVDGLEVTFSDEVNWGIITNTWSRDFTEEYFYIEVTLNNVSDSTERWPFARQFSPDGTELDTIFGESDSIADVGQLRAGASQSGYLHFRFDGAGEYVAALRGAPFDIEVSIPITAADIPCRDEVSQTLLEAYIEANSWEFNLIMGLLTEEGIDVDIEVREGSELAFVFTIEDELLEGVNLGELAEALDEYILEESFVFQELVDELADELRSDNVSVTVIYQNSAGREITSSTWTAGQRST